MRLRAPGKCGSEGNSRSPRLGLDWVCELASVPATARSCSLGVEAAVSISSSIFVRVVRASCSVRGL